jgi:hypothetical protein
LGAAPRTGFAATLGFAGAALAGFAGACAAGGAVVFELWPSAGTLTSIVAMALIVILRIREILGKTRLAAEMKAAFRLSCYCGLIALPQRAGWTLTD